MLKHLIRIGCVVVLDSEFYLLCFLILVDLSEIERQRQFWQAMIVKSYSLPLG